jgi:hypothetical protein
MRKRRKMPSNPSSSLLRQRRVNRMRRNQKRWRIGLFHQPLIFLKIFISNNFTLILFSMDLKKLRTRTTQRAILNGFPCITLLEEQISKKIGSTPSSINIFSKTPSSSSNFYPGVI